MSRKRMAIKFKTMADSSSSSGSDHFPSGSLSDMVNSFLERPAEVDGSAVRHDLQNDEAEREHGEDSDSRTSSIEERKELLKKLLEQDESNVDATMKNNIIKEIEAFNTQSQSQSHITCVDSGFKRRLMAHLRRLGYDAGLCKSKWEKTGRYVAGTYEYIDIISSSGDRDIIEVNPSSLFEIARPTDGYISLLEGLPRVFVGKSEKLKEVARVMSAAMKESLKSNALPVAPWRRKGYLQAQWFSPYKRTINADACARPLTGPVAEPQSKVRRVVVGFVEEMNLPARNCGREFSNEGGRRSGLLAEAFQPKLLQPTKSQ